VAGEGIVGSGVCPPPCHPMKARRDVKVEHLREVRLFDGCSHEELERIARLADEIAVPAGYVLVYEGDWGHEVFVVAEGEAEVTAGGRMLALLDEGAVIGELAVLNPGPRTATVVAASPMRFFVFDDSSFEALLREHPVIARRTMTDVAARFQGQSLELADERERVV
jgi:CRP/FNR family transcriptional regulator, cyclic AMP receptor protein